MNKSKILFLFEALNNYQIIHCKQRIELFVCFNGFTNFAFQGLTPQKVFMIAQIFLLQLVLTFFIGSCWIYFTVLAGLRLGSKMGGFIGGLPSTALLSFFFIGFTQSPQTASEVTTVFPLAIAVSCLFLVVYAYSSAQGFIAGMLISLLFWIIVSGMVANFHTESFVINLLIYCGAVTIAFFVMEKYLLIKAIPSNKVVNPKKLLLTRSVIGGLVVTISVLVAKTAGPVFGGIIAAFPAMFISILAISYKTQGIEFSRAMTKPLMVTGMITVAVYAVAIRYLYLWTGLYIGTLVAICISGISAYFTYRYILPGIK